MEMTDILSDLSAEEMDEFVGSDSSSPRRRYPAASDEIKLSVEEVRQSLDGMPDDLSPEKAQEERIRRLGEALLVKCEMTLVDSFVRTALGPDPTKEQCGAMQAALGHMYRLGGMFMRTHTAVPMYAPVVKAAALDDVRKKRWSDEKRMLQLEIVDAWLRDRNGRRVKLWVDALNKELDRHGLKHVSAEYLHKRWRTIQTG